MDQVSTFPLCTAARPLRIIRNVAELKVEVERARQAALASIPEGDDAYRIKMEGVLEALELVTAMIGTMPA